jgi:hypothetical protein
VFFARVLRYFIGGLQLGNYVRSHFFKYIYIYDTQLYMSSDEKKIQDQTPFIFLFIIFPIEDTYFTLFLCIVIYLLFLVILFCFSLVSRLNSFVG